MSPASDPKEELLDANVRKEFSEYSNLPDGCPDVATNTLLFNHDKSLSMPYDQSPKISVPEIPRRPKRKGPLVEDKGSSEKSNPTDPKNHVIPESVGSDKNLAALQMSQAAPKETTSEQKFLHLQKHHSEVDSPIDEQFSLTGRAISEDSLDFQDRNVRSDMLPLDFSSENKDGKIGNLPVVPSKRPVRSTKKDPGSAQDGSSTSYLGSHIQQPLSDPSVDGMDDSGVSYTAPLREETLVESQIGKVDEEIDESSNKMQLSKVGLTEETKPSKMTESTIVDRPSTELEAGSQTKPTASKKPSSKIAAFQQMFENRQQGTNASLRSEPHFEHPPKATTTDHKQSKPPFEQEHAHTHAKDVNLNAQFIKNLNGMIGMALPGMVVPGVATGSSVDMESATESEVKHDYDGTSVSEIQPLKNTVTGRIKGPRGRRLPKTVSEPFEKPNSCFELFIEDIWQLITVPSAISESSVDADYRVSEDFTMIKKEGALSSENQSSNEVSNLSSEVIEELETEMQYDDTEILAKGRLVDPRKKVITETPIQAVDSISDNLSIDSASH
ncbi:hypothetical protein LJB42_004148 [Komagataella kurtzmanii]|nr:hypothetical protein LJB42_004148 [Komagataella kurtzmanii]